MVRFSISSLLWRDNGDMAESLLHACSNALDWISSSISESYFTSVVIKTTWQQSNVRSRLCGLYRVRIPCHAEAILRGYWWHQLM